MQLKSFNLTCRSQQRDSNSRPSVYETDALTTVLCWHQFLRRCARYLRCCAESRLANESLALNLILMQSSMLRRLWPRQSLSFMWPTTNISEIVGVTMTLLRCGFRATALCIETVRFRISPNLLRSLVGRLGWKHSNCWHMQLWACPVLRWGTLSVNPSETRW